MSSIEGIDSFDNVRDVLSRLSNVKKIGNGWSARCPAHDDQHNSLSVSTGNDGRLLIYCHAGCSFESISSALNINRSTGKRIVATYDYIDEDGELLFQSVRFEPKNFLQRRPDGTGGWIWNLKGMSRVLYRLPQLVESEEGATVYVVEGEKDADRLAALGFIATSNSGGAGKWRDEYSEYLSGKHIIIIPDNDEPGQQHAEQVARSVYGVAASVRVAALPGLPPKGDVSDWLDGKGVENGLQEIVESAPLWMPEGKEQLEEPVEEPAAATRVLLPYGAFMEVPFGTGEEIAFELRRRELGLIASVTNVGKSTLVRNAVLALTTGRQFEPFVKGGEPRRVGLLDFESSGSRAQDDFERMTQDWSCAEQSLLKENLFVFCDGMIGDDPLRLTQHMPIVMREAQECGIDLLVVDTSGAAFDIHNENDNGEVARKVMKPLLMLARKLNCAVVIVHHIGKSKSEEGSGADKVHRPRGASVFSGYAAGVFVMTGDASDPDYVTVTCAKRKNGAPYEVPMKLDRASRWFEAVRPAARTPSSYERVVEYVQEADAPVRLMDIASALKSRMSRDTVKRNLSEALRRGDLTSTGRGLYAAKGSVGAELYSSSLLHLSSGHAFSDLMEEWLKMPVN
jgi:putative DNA primase/helicase